MELSRQEYRGRLLFLSPGDLPDPGINPSLLHCGQILVHLSHQGIPDTSVIVKVLPEDSFGWLVGNLGKSCWAVSRAQRQVVRQSVCSVSWSG